MLERLKQNISGQLMLMLCCTLGAALFGIFGHYQPLLRLSGRTLLQGLQAGVLLLCCEGLYALFLLLTGNAAAKEYWRFAAQEQRRSSLPVLLGALLVTALGEEIFLRAYVFGFFASDFFWLSLIGNMLLTAALFFDGRSSLPSLGIRIIEAAFLGFLYDRHRSMAMLAAARGVARLGALGTLRSKHLERVLNVRRRVIMKTVHS
jgi:membrane protease YdiL (CAAX protease family)